MTNVLRYELSESIATITMDDGKVNCISPRMLSELNAAFDRADQDKAVVLLAGREGMFCGGFDLSVFKKSPTDIYQMLKQGAEFAERIMQSPRPVVIACTGHCVAMGALFMLSADQRIGADGKFKTVLNEVAIGMTMPEFGVEIARARLTPSYLNRSLITAEPFLPAQALEAGFLDRVVPASDVLTEARSVALLAAKLDPRAHLATKLRVRAPVISALRQAIDNELGSEDKYMNTIARAGIPGQ